jgi:hypothetical protein
MERREFKRAWIEVRENLKAKLLSDVKFFWDFEN